MTYLVLWTLVTNKMCENERLPKLSAYLVDIAFHSIDISHEEAGDNEPKTRLM